MSETSVTTPDLLSLLENLCGHGREGLVPGVRAIEALLPDAEIELCLGPEDEPGRGEWRALIIDIRSETLTPEQVFEIEWVDSGEGHWAIGTMCEQPEVYIEVNGDTALRLLVPGLSYEELDDILGDESTDDRSSRSHLLQTINRQRATRGLAPIMVDPNAASPWVGP